MHKPTLKNALIAFLAVMTIFVVFKYILYLRNQVGVLEEQRQNLSQALAKEKMLTQKFSRQNLLLKEYLSAGKKRLSRLFRENSVVQASLEDMNSKFSLLQAENKALRDENEKILKENDNLKARLGTAAGFKKALGELKKQVLKVGREVKRRSDKEEFIGGNRGYVIKDGKSTLSTKVKIEVIPAPAQ